MDKNKFLIHFVQGLSPQNENLLWEWCYNLNKNYLNEKAICTEKQNKIATQLFQVLQEINQDKLLFDVFINTFNL